MEDDKKENTAAPANGEADAPGQKDAELAIYANGVHKKYLSNEVLRGFDLAVPKGKAYGCAGVNGAGKSTFLKCLLDFCHYDKGTIEIFGQSSKNRLSRSRICFLPERFVPPYYLNGRQFVKFVMSLNHERYDEDRTVEMLKSMDLDLEALEKPVRSFSKGMTQKLGLASIFLLKRDLYILDEPMSGLDPKARALLKRLFRKIHDEDGGTLFFTSHSLSDIEEVCEEMALLHGGKVCFAGPPDDLLAHKGGETLEDAFMKLIQEPAATGEASAAS